MESNSQLLDGLISPHEDPEQYAGTDEGRPEDDGKIYMSVDDMLAKHVGEFGFAQFWHFVLVSLGWTVDALHTMVMIFGDRVPEWQCKSQIGLQAGVGLNDTFTLATPLCTSASSLCELDPGTWEWVGRYTRSTVSEWGLICAEEYKAGLAASLFFIGVLCGAGIYGSLSDSFLGRKGTVTLSCLTTVFLGLLTSFSPSYWIYASLRFMTGLNCGSIGVCSFVLATEIVGPSKRGSVGMATFYFFTGGIMILPLFGYFSTSWRMLYFSTAVPGIVYCFLVLPFLWESPRWYLVQGRSDDAMKVMRSIAKWNGNELPAGLHLRLDRDQRERDAQVERRAEEMSLPRFAGDETNSLSSESKDRQDNSAVRSAVSLGEDDASQPEAQYEGTLIDVFRYAETRWRMLIMVCIWFCTGVCYYGISLNAVNLNFNLYVSVFMNGLIEIPALAGTAYLLSKMGRKSQLVSAMALSGVCCVCGSFFFVMGKPDGLKGGNSFLLRGFTERMGSNHTNFQLNYTDSNEEFLMGVLRLMWGVLGMLGMEGAFSLIYIYTAELFPTVVRNAALGLAVQAAGVGEVIAPFIVVSGHFSPSLPFVIFGILALGGAALSTRLPETLNQRLYDTMEDMERENTTY